MRKLNWEYLTLFANFLNYAIFVFLSVNLIGTQCFSIKQIFIVAFGLFTSIIIQLLSVSLAEK